MIFFYQLDPEVDEINAAETRLREKFAELLTYELRLTYLFMPFEEYIVIPPTFWIESERTSKILSDHHELIEVGAIKFIMNEKDYQDFKEKKTFRYKKLLHIARFSHGYGSTTKSVVEDMPALIVPKLFSTGTETLARFLRSANIALKSVFSRKNEIDEFLTRLQDTQTSVFIWESVAEELRAVGKDTGQAERAGLRGFMDRTYLETYRSSGMIMPGRSLVDHKIIISDAEAQWCKIQHLDSIAQMASIRDFIISSPISRLIEVKQISEWWHACIKVRELIKDGKNPEAIMLEIERYDLAGIIRKVHETNRLGGRAQRMTTDNEVVGSVVFLTVEGICKAESIAMANVLSDFHRSIRALAQNLPEVLGFPAMSGAILVFQDRHRFRILDFVRDLTSTCTEKRIPLRVGIHRGNVKLFHDVDGRITAIDEVVNISARLAYADREVIQTTIPTSNTAILSKQFIAYQLQAEDLLSEVDTHWMKPNKLPNLLSSIRGKREEFFECYLFPIETLPYCDNQEFLTDDRVSNCEIEKKGGTLIIAYDLPKFSAGDQLRLSSRFKDVRSVVVEEINRSRVTEDFCFCPGGDGGIIVLEDSDQRDAFQLATRIGARLLSLDRIRTDDASTVARIAVHYGDTYYYKDLNNHRRPIGRSLFIADRLASDDAGRSSGGIVFSEALRTAASDGDNLMFEELYEYLPPLETSYGFAVGRFSTRRRNVQISSEEARE